MPCVGTETAGPWRQVTLTRILLLAAALRLLLAGAAWVHEPSGARFHALDSPSYVASAESLVREGRFERDGQPEIIRTPGYPLVLLPGVALGRVEAVTVLLQIGLSCLTVVAVYRLGGCVLPGDAWARGAALAYACEPLSVLYCSKLLSETTFTCCVAWALCLVAEHFLRYDARRLWFAAVLLACATYVRPISYFLPLPIAVGLMVLSVTRRGLSWKELACCGMFLWLALAPVWAWQVRNEREAGYARFSAIEDINLYYYNAAAVLARRSGETLSATQQSLGYLRPDIYEQLHPEQRNWTPAERYDYLHQAALGILRRNLGAYLRVHLAGMPPLLLGTGVTEFSVLLGGETPAHAAQRNLRGSLWQRGWRLAEQQPVAFVGNVIFVLWIALAWLLALRAVVSRELIANGAGLLLVGATIYFALLAAGPTGTHRMRHPIMPLLVVLSTQGLALLGSLRLSLQRFRRPAVLQYVKPRGESS